MKKWIRYIVIFIFVFCSYEFFGFPNMYGDPINNYMFSHAIVMGEVPYLDFNTISTPLYAFLMAIGLLFFDNYLMFVIEQSLLVTIMFYFLFELYGKKCYLVLLVICLFAFFGINATYNFLALFFLVILLYLEKKYSEKDYLIGFVIGCTILSKHTIGCLLFLPSLFYYFKDIKKIGKRIVGILIPCTIFFIYLLVNNAVYPFINLCFLGLFDFSSKNGNVFSVYVLFSLVLFLIQFFITIKKKNDIRNCYLMMGIAFMIPLFDFQHFAIYMICFVIQLLPFLQYREDYFGNVAAICSVVVSIFLFINYCILLKPVFSTELSHFQYSLVSRFDYSKSLETYDFFDRYENKLLLTYSSVPYDVSRDYPITYFNIFMKGNFGYDGSRQMIEKIQNMENIYIIVDMRQYQIRSIYNQYDKTIVKYVIDHYEKVDTWKDFVVYYKN